MADSGVCVLCRVSALTYSALLNMSDAAKKISVDDVAARLLAEATDTVEKAATPEGHQILKDVFNDMADSLRREQL